MKNDKNILRTLPAIISLFAALVISIVMIAKRADTLKALIAIFSVLLGFYVVGSLFRAVLIAMSTKEEEKEEDKDLENIESEENSSK